MKSVFLYVFGGDYAALDFERKYDPLSFYYDMLKEGKRYVVINSDEMYAEVKIKEFNDFISDDALVFIKDSLCDYDDLKHTNLYKVI